MPDRVLLDRTMIEILGGRHLDRLERRAGEGRIAARTVVHDRSTAVPSSRFPDLGRYVQGRRDRSDPVSGPGLPTHRHVLGPAVE